MCSVEQHLEMVKKKSTQVYSSGGENSSGNATSPSVPSFLPSSTNPSDSSEDSDNKGEPDDASDDTSSDSEEESSPGTDGKTLESKGVELEKDEEEKEKGGKEEEKDGSGEKNANESDQSSLKALHALKSGSQDYTDSAALMERMIKLQKQVDQQKSLERKEEEAGEEKEKETGSEETKSEEGDSNASASMESSERSLSGKEPKEIQFKTLNQIEEVTRNSDQEQDGKRIATKSLPGNTGVMESATDQNEKEGELERSSSFPAKEGLTEDKILRRIAAIEKYRKDAESSSNGKDHLAVQVVERYKVWFGCLPS